MEHLNEQIFLSSQKRVKVVCDMYHITAENTTVKVSRAARSKITTENTSMEIK